MEEVKESNFQSETEKYGIHLKKRSTEVFDGGQVFSRYQDGGDQSDQNDCTPPSSSLSPFSMTSTEERNEFCHQDENDVLLAEGVVAQQKRLLGKNNSKIELKKYNDFLISKIKDLEDRLANRDMMVSALQRELDLVRDMSVVDASAGPLTSSTFSPDSGDSFQQTGSPLTKNEEKLLIKLKKKDTELSLLAEEIKLRDKQNISEQLSNKLFVLECEVKEQAETIDQLNLEVVQKNKMLDHLQDQLQKKSEDFCRQNMKNSLEMKNLMKNVEELGRELRNKDNELKMAKEELSNLRRELEHNFCSQLADVKAQLKLSHDEDKSRLNVIYDDLKVRYSKAHETEIACYKKQIETLTNRVKENGQSEHELETELEACRLACEVQVSSYKECVENLMEELAAEKEKNETEVKGQMEKYKTELERCRFELDNYRQQMKNIDTKLAEEKKAIEERCAEQIESIHSKYEAQLVIYKCCTDSLKKKEQIASEEMASLESNYKENINELKKEIEDNKKEIEHDKKEINECNIKLKESQNNEKNLTEELLECKFELEKFIDKNNLLSEKLQAKESGEACIINELKKYHNLVDEYDGKIKEFEKFREEMASAEERHDSEISTFQNQIDHLMSTLTTINSSHKQEMNQLVEQLMVQHQQLETLQELAECDSIDSVFEKLKELKECKEEIALLSEKLDIATNSVGEYENRLSELHKCYEKEISVYKNQIEKLKEELSNASCLEENLVQQLNSQMTGVKESKEQVKDLLLRKDVQVYFVQNEVSSHNMSDTTSSTKGVSNSKYQGGSELSDCQGVVPDEIKLLYNQLDHLNNENQALKQQLDDLKKPKSNISIQLHGYNDSQKRHIEEALFKELEKELHDCKIDNSTKSHDIEELMKANRDLAEHYSKLKEQLSNLREFAAQKVMEINLLQNENEQLTQERTQLQSHQIALLAKLDSFGENSDEVTNMDNLPEEPINLNVGSQQNHNMKNLFKNVATSTPNLIGDETREYENDALTPRRKVFDYKTRTNQLLSKWMANCNDLELENTELKKKIELLKLQMKEMECCSETIKSQMGSFEENCVLLKTRIIELESKKQVLKELELMNEQLKLRNEKLEEDRHILRSEVANLKEENINIEKKYDETLAKFLGQNTKGNEVVEELIFELNKKGEQVLLLKEELAIRQENITSLEDELDKMLEIRKEMTTRLDTLVQDLKISEEEVLNLRQERLNVDLEKRLIEKKLLVLRAQNEQLLKHFSNKAHKNCNNGIITIVEELEKELIELHKNLSAERGVIERMAVEKTFNKNSGNSSDGSETSYKIELLLNAFEQLQNEKEGLKRKTLELQEIINKYLDSNDVDEDWKLEVKESQKNILLELETYGKQHADLGKSLLETENLKGKVELAEKELLLKIEEKTRVEDLLAAERQGLKNALNRIHFLEKQLGEKMNVLQVLGEEKEDLQGNLLALQEKLSSLEEHLQQQKLILEEEIQERELRVRHAHLELHAAQLDKNMIINKMILDAEAETEMERVSHLREELEKEHDMAISRLKRLYTTQLHEVMEGAAAQQQVIEQNHHEQVMIPYVLSTTNTTGSNSMELE